MSRTRKDWPFIKSARSCLAFMPKKFRQLMTRKRRRIQDAQTREAIATGETNLDKPQKVANAKWEWL